MTEKKPFWASLKDQMYVVFIASFLEDLALEEQLNFGGETEGSACVQLTSSR